MKCTHCRRINVHFAECSHTTKNQSNAEQVKGVASQFVMVRIVVHGRVCVENGARCDGLGQGGNLRVSLEPIW